MILRPSRWSVLGVVFLARTSMGYQLQAMGSVGPVQGFAVPRYGHADATMVVLLLGGGVIASLIPMLEIWTVLFALFGFSAWTPAGSIVALPVALLSVHSLALGIGDFPGLAGALRDHTGSPGAPIVFAATLFVAAVVFPGLLRIAERRLVPAPPAATTE